MTERLISSPQWSEGRPDGKDMRPNRTMVACCETMERLVTKGWPSFQNSCTRSTSTSVWSMHLLCRGWVKAPSNFLFFHLPSSYRLPAGMFKSPLQCCIPMIFLVIYTSTALLNLLTASLHHSHCHSTRLSSLTHHYAVQIPCARVNQYFHYSSRLLVVYGSVLV